MFNLNTLTYAHHLYTEAQGHALLQTAMWASLVGLVALVAKVRVGIFH